MSGTKLSSSLLKITGVCSPITMIKADMLDQKVLNHNTDADRDAARKAQIFFKVLESTRQVGSPHHEGLDADRKANAFLDVPSSLNQVYTDDPACRLLLQEIADYDDINHLFHDGDKFIHGDRFLSYFRSSKPPKIQKKPGPCGPCSIGKVKVCCYLVDMPNYS